jgi:16S rRNA (cytosine1402-N4)-methyltransferase
MRMGPDAPLSAAALIDRLSTEELARVLRDFGEQPRSHAVARAIKRARQAGALQTTLQLAAVVAGALGEPRQKTHPATRTFQALRIAVNDELGALQQFLETFVDALRPGGRVAIIAFHSLEDRAVKRCFARLTNPCICPPDLPRCACGRSPLLRLLTRRPLRPGAKELEGNPRARSARLRAAERI